MLPPLENLLEVPALAVFDLDAETPVNPERADQVDNPGIGVEEVSRRGFLVHHVLHERVEPARLDARDRETLDQ